MSTIESRPKHLGPLTTAWSQPSSCLGPVFHHESYDYCTDYGSGYCTASYGATCNLRGGRPDDNTECWPPRNPGFTADTSLLGWGFYSPGLACPEGYYEACSATFAGNSDWVPQFPLTTGETAVGCCPREFSCQNKYVSFKGRNAGVDAQTCILKASFTRLSATICDRGETYETAFAVPTFDHYWEEKIDSIDLYAPLFQMNWKLSDKLGVDTDAPVDETPSRGLSPSAKAGIGIGVSVAVLGLLAMVWFILRYRRSKLGQEQPSIGIEMPGGDHGLISQQNYELPNQHDGGYQHRALDGNVVVAGGASGIPGQEKYEFLSPVAESHREETYVGTQDGQRMMNRPYETPDRVYEAHESVVNEGVGEKKEEHRGHVATQIHYQEIIVVVLIPTHPKAFHANKQAVVIFNSYSTQPLRPPLFKMELLQMLHFAQTAILYTLSRRIRQAKRLAGWDPEQHETDEYNTQLAYEMQPMRYALLNEPYQRRLKVPPEYECIRGRGGKVI
ncbi:hypothetical protein F5Y08DRAFT_355640 [Xylaria arbuscula]|nr:hypothetical protein F5Y08DRAFT_355640 [Xylaria arbuscula]